LADKVFGLGPCHGQAVASGKAFISQVALFSENSAST
jgi:hypothetical protein